MNEHGMTRPQLAKWYRDNPWAEGRNIRPDICQSNKICSGEMQRLPEEMLIRSNHTANFYTARNFKEQQIAKRQR